MGQQLCDRCSNGVLIAMCELSCVERLSAPLPLLRLPEVQGPAWVPCPCSAPVVTLSRGFVCLLLNESQFVHSLVQA